MEVRWSRVPLTCFPVFISEWSCLSRFVHSRGGVGFLSVTLWRHRLRVDGGEERVMVTVALTAADTQPHTHTSYTLSSSPLIIDTSAPFRENTVLRFVNRERKRN